MYLCLRLNVADMVLILSKMIWTWGHCGGFADKFSWYAHKTVSFKLKIRQFPKNVMPQKQDVMSQFFFSLKLNFQNQFKLDQGSKAPSAKTQICSLTHKGLYCFISDSI